jgi:histidinol-phosphate phosphatase family protein
MLNGLILAAGLGQRLQPLTNYKPKCLLPILGKPLLDYWIDQLVACGVNELRINTHVHRNQLTQYITQIQNRNSLRLVESYEPNLLGSAGTVTANSDLADDVDTIVIIYADNFSTISLLELVNFHRSHCDPMTILLFHSDNPKQCGIAVLDSANRVVEFVEKSDNPPHNLANAGIYVIDASLYRQIADMNAFDFGFDVLPKLVGQMRGWWNNNYHRDIGVLPSYQKACMDAPSVLPSLGYFCDGTRPAVFLDRDGTLLEFVHNLSTPQQVCLAIGAVDAIIRLHQHGWACVVVTNQAQIGRGLLTDECLQDIHREMHRQLAHFGVGLDGVYHCPLVPISNDRTVVEFFDRKPGPGMLLRAADDLHLCLKESWFVGDMISDVFAGQNAGCKGSVLVKSIKSPPASDLEKLPNTFVASTLADAVDIILEAV